MTKNKKTITIIIGIVLALIAVGGIVYTVRSLTSQNTNTTNRRPTPPPEPVNVIPVSDRPYIELQPISARNTLEITIHELKKPATSVEVTLEYDRNEGVLDAVLKQFSLTKLPFSDNLFLGSKSAGGHITYHDDVIGGKLTLKFTGDDRYTLEVPWRYNDEDSPFSQLSTTDGHFQAVLADPITDPKVIVMQSPGLPEPLEGEVISGPFLIRAVNPLPETTAELTFRLDREVENPMLYGWDGESWQSIEDIAVDGKSLSASGDLFEVFVITTL